MGVFKKKTVIIAGDLNLDRLRLDRSEGNSEGPRRSQWPTLPYKWTNKGGHGKLANTHWCNAYK